MVRVKVNLLKGFMLRVVEVVVVVLGGSYQGDQGGQATKNVRFFSIWCFCIIVSEWLTSEPLPQMS